MNSLELVHFSPNDVLFKEGDKTFFFYMIKEGRVEVYREDDDARKIVLAVIEEGQSLGEFAMIDKQPRSASARALTDVVAVKISEQAYASLLDELPAWVQAMLEGLVSRLRKANEIIRQHEAIDEKTKTGFEASEYENQEITKSMEFDFSDLSSATLETAPANPKKTG